MPCSKTITQTFVSPQVQLQLATARLVDIAVAMQTAAFDSMAQTRHRWPEHLVHGTMAGQNRGDVITVYDLGGQDCPLSDTPARITGGPIHADPVVEAAFQNATLVQRFYAELFNSDSITGDGMPVELHVHLGDKTNNAEWDGGRALFGDGDGKVFKPFPLSLEVVGHELSHGAIRLEYFDQSGALNESFADVMAAMIVQWHKRLSVDQANWLIGTDTLIESLGLPGVRSFTATPAFEEVAGLSGDKQPKHMQDYVVTTFDNGGVHINCGIPNHAFYLAATKIGGNAWELAGKIWFEALTRLDFSSDFQAAAAKTVWAAREMFHDRVAAEAFRDAWHQVGIEVELK
jgi:Zn-dependent metalloprotease